MNFSQKMFYYLKWVAVIPTALLSGIIVTFPLHWILYRTLSGGSDPIITPYPELPERLIQPFVSAFVIVYIAAKIAPDRKLKTALVIMNIWVLVAISLLILGYFGYSFSNIKLFLQLGGLPVFMGIVGSVLGVLTVRKEINANQQEN